MNDQTTLPKPETLDKPESEHGSGASPCYAAIVVQQPFADLIAAGEKTIENRGWATRYRGPLVIVAGKSSRYLSSEALAKRRTGIIVAVVDLIDCVPVEAAPNTPHTEGPICWVLDNVRPIPNGRAIRGMPGLFRVGELT